MINFKLTIYPKCWWLNHNWSTYGVPFRVHDSYWEQSKVCVDCGKVKVRNIGFHNTNDIKVPEKLTYD